MLATNRADPRPAQQAESCNWDVGTKYEPYLCVLPLPKTHPMKRFALLLCCSLWIAVSAIAQDSTFKVPTWDVHLEGQMPASKLTEDQWYSAEFHYLNFHAKPKAQSSTSVPGAIRLRFEKDKYFMRQGSIYLRPATKKSLQECYEAELAKSLGLITTTWQLVRLKINGNEAGLFVANEKPDVHLMEKNGITGVPMRFYMDSKTKPSKRVKCDDKALRKTTTPLFEAMANPDSDPRCYPMLPRELAAIAAIRVVSGYKPLPVKLEGFVRSTNARMALVYHTESEPLTGYDLDYAYEHMLNKATFQRNFTSAIQQMRRALPELQVRFSELAAMLETATANYPISDPGYSHIIDALLAEKNLLETGQKVQTTVGLHRPKLPCNREGNTLEALQELGLFTVDGDTLRTQGTVYVEEAAEPIIIPMGYTWLLEAGANLQLGSKVSILSWSPLVAAGTEDSPAYIAASKPSEPFGTIMVAGTGKTLCSLRWLNVSGGSEGKVAGIYCPGAMGLFHTDVTMKHCDFSGNTADDGLNVKYGRVDIQESSFHDNFADQVDLDFCAGTVKNCRFENAKGDSNGDGLDVSGARELHISDCVFSGFDDKGLSVGEASRVIIERCRISGNTTGIAAKDLSIVLCHNNVLSNNKTAYHVFQKKQIFGGASLFWCKDKQQDNKLIANIDNPSGSRSGQLENWDNVRWENYLPVPVKPGRRKSK